MKNEINYPDILHHGAVNGVTGSCHELMIDSDNSVLIDCGLFQGAEKSAKGSNFDQLEIDFSVENVQALLITHCHIDHVGRIPYLLAAGFEGLIYCTHPTAALLPLILEDAVRIGFTRNERLIFKFIKRLKNKIVPIDYHQVQKIQLTDTSQNALSVCFRPAGHILGSAYIECDVQRSHSKQRIVFSGDLGSTDTPLLPMPESPSAADVLVLESTYGDRNHVGRKERKTQLKDLIVHCLRNEGTMLIPAFSIGRTQELLYELEDIIHQHKEDHLLQDLVWDDLEIIVDSPLASEFTEVYRSLKPYWDAEATIKVESGRHPLSFQQLKTINSHQQHLETLDYLKQTGKPCVVIAASGMCAGGRIVNYLKALIEDFRTDIVFTGYQARGTTGRQIQRYAHKGGYVEIDDQRYQIKAGVYSLTGYSAHADQRNLIDFVRGIKLKPQEIRLIHGDRDAKLELQKRLASFLPETKVWIPT